MQECVTNKRVEVSRLSRVKGVVKFYSCLYCVIKGKLTLHVGHCDFVVCSRATS